MVVVPCGEVHIDTTLQIAVSPSKNSSRASSGQEEAQCRKAQRAKGEEGIAGCDHENAHPEAEAHVLQLGSASWRDALWTVWIVNDAFSFGADHGDSEGRVESVEGKEIIGKGRQFPMPTRSVPVSAEASGCGSFLSQLNRWGGLH